MFVQRHRQLFHSVTHDCLAAAIDIESFAAMLLSMPIALRLSAEAARTALAVSNLPDVARTPTVYLSQADRVVLQIDCLYRRFLSTTLNCNLRLLNITVHMVIKCGMAAAILGDETNFLLQEMASLMWQTGGIPTSSHHWAWHEFGPARADLSIRRRGSESDLESLVARACDCEYLAEELELMHREAAEFRREFQSVLAADEYDWEDDGLDDSCASLTSLTLDY
jgi:hypothetical protein